MRGWVKRVCLSVCVTDESSERMSSLSGAGLPMWRPGMTSRLMHLPYTSPLSAGDRSMYSAMYGNLLGLAAGSAAGTSTVTLPTFTFNPFTSGTLTSGGSLAAASHMIYGSQDSSASSGTNLYNSSLYGHRYHPYLSTAASQLSKRINDSSVLQWDSDSLSIVESTETVYTEVSFHVIYHIWN